MRALSKATSNVSGICNQLVNTYYRSEEGGVYDELAQAFVDKDVKVASRLLGQFTKDFLMTEIPDASAAGAWSDVGTLM